MANTYNTLIVFFILFASFFNNWVCVTTFSRRAERLNYCAYKYVYDHKIILYIHKEKSKEKILRIRKSR